ncbi:polysaccharide deacetylase family protein [Streptomyces sp. NPDC021056]|uniref:polysaccharide deacetylase family protein n=1 Tax=Streptomyces sp. NPDC021056 TaxID=3155012 RepID=UPI0033C7002C
MGKVATRDGESLVGFTTESSCAILTYDDGPDHNETTRILSALSEKGAKATFFVLVRDLTCSISLLREILDEGNEIGLHGDTHRRLPSVTARELEHEIRDSRHLLEDVLGESVRWFRPPYGSQNIRTWRSVCDAGMFPVLWEIECRDWEDRPFSEYLQPIRDHRENGAIIALHDGFAGDPRKRPKILNRRRLTEEIIGLLQDKGMDTLAIGAADILPDCSRRTRIWLDRVDSPDEVS